ncbi:hypothetical protein JW766_03980 [Candidatus Dojkabacteria bacterium]|nr:hypothetical protein [Candidatus Dojkabacteria bacterium]
MKTKHLIFIASGFIITILIVVSSLVVICGDRECIKKEEDSSEVAVFSQEGYGDLPEYPSSQIEPTRDKDVIPDDINNVFYNREKSIVRYVTNDSAEYVSEWYDNVIEEGGFKKEKIYDSGVVVFVQEKTNTLYALYISSFGEILTGEKTSIIIASGPK